MERLKIPDQLNGKTERGNIYQCQKHVRRWIDNPNLTSHEVVPALYTTLFQSSGLSSGDHTQLSDVIRTSDVRISGKSRDFCPPSLYVYPLMTKYLDDLDNVLHATPNSFDGANIGNVIHNAAWAYYVFERIHPFPDGNGRVGRMIVKRIVNGAGVKDLLFHDSRWRKSERSTHLDALSRVDDSGELRPLELYVLDLLERRYDSTKEANIYQAIQRAKVANFESNDVRSQAKMPSDIWQGFENVPISGNNPLLVLQAK